MLQGHIDLDTATPVEASAIPDVLFERGLYWASGRSGVVNLVAAHKWLNLAALKGRPDAVPLRREVAMAQREARAWMTANGVFRGGPSGPSCSATAKAMSSRVAPAVLAHGQRLDLPLPLAPVTTLSAVSATPDLAQR